MTFREKALKLMAELREADLDNMYYGKLGLKFEKFFDSVYKRAPEHCTDVEIAAIMGAKTPWEEEYISEMFEEWQCKPQ